VAVTYDGSPAAPMNYKAGGYAVIASLTNQNYTASNVTGTLLIDKAAATLALTDLLHAYDGTAKSVTVTTTPSGLTGVTVTYDGLATAPTDHKADGYAVVASLANQNYSVTDATGTLRINKATATVSVNGDTSVYDGAAHGATGSATGIGSADLSALVDLGASFTSVPGGTANWTFNAGSANPNYNIASGSVEIAISAKTASVTADSKTKVYGDGNPTLTATVSGNAGSETLNYALATAATVGSPVGTQAITVTLGSNPNYNVTPNNGTLMVTPASLNEVTDNRMRQYGEPNPAFTGSVNGLKNGDVITANRSTTAMATSPIGDYPIAAILNDPGNKLSNYAVTNPGGTLTITKATLTLVADNKSRPFGVANPSFTGSYSGEKNSESFTLSFSTAAQVSSPVGTYAIVSAVAGPTLGNYNIVTPNGTLTVGAWTLTGFHRPVGIENSIATAPGGALPTQASVWNTLNGGQTVPLKFNLYASAGGAALTSVSDVAGFTLTSVSCAPGLEDLIETDFTTTGGTTLRYDGTQFVQNWQTQRNANRCYRVTMQALDGSRISAFFKTK
jgi:hypothetical protein